MQKFLKELKQKDANDWAQLVKYMCQNHSDTFAVLSWGELLKIVDYCREYQFQIDFHKLMQRLEVPPFEAGMINSMINSTKEHRIEQKQKQHHAASERTKRLIDNYAHNREVDAEIRKLQATKKIPRATDIKGDFEKLANDIL